MPADCFQHHTSTRLPQSVFLCLASSDTCSHRVLFFPVHSAQVTWCWHSHALFLSSCGFWSPWVGWRILDRMCYICACLLELNPKQMESRLLIQLFCARHKLAVSHVCHPHSLSVPSVMLFPIPNNCTSIKGFCMLDSSRIVSLLNLWGLIPFDVILSFMWCLPVRCSAHSKLCQCFWFPIFLYRVAL